ncbi:MAG: hypothetical protein N2Z70_02350 [Bdellovibrionaceae bacterium]|nr:hypothetical protein [Pseudobdellovibrionaceae bacterium]
MHNEKRNGWIRTGAIWALTAQLMTGCGGGGSVSVGIGVGVGGGGGTALYYPYETVYGDICATTEPTPGCTFDRRTGQRITVSQDPHYDRYFGASDDMWYVEFDNRGVARVYDEDGRFRYYADVSQFAGWVGGTYIGVGTSGAYWEDIRNGTYWLGKNGVLYSANLLESNFGQAINEDGASEETITSLVATRTAANRKLVANAAEKLAKKYEMPIERARVIASSLNSFAVAGVERGFVTSKDVDQTFRAVFGVPFQSALTAIKDLQKGETAAITELTQQSAQYLGLKPHQAKEFVKDMYRSALAEYGYNIDDVNW